MRPAARSTGCFRTLQTLQREIGAQLVGGGRVFYRSRGGAIEGTTRADFSARAKRGEITPATPVFDTGLTDAAAWRTRFEAAGRRRLDGGLLQVGADVVGVRDRCR